MNFQNLDLNLLRVLDAMLRERSTTRVSERLRLSQPAVSAGLSRLRRSLGDPLFVRQGNAMVPTAYAESLAAPLRRVLDDLEATLSGPNDFDSRTSRRVFKVFATDYYSELVIPRLIDTMAHAAPLMRLQLVYGPQEILFREIGEGIVDMGIYPTLPGPDWVMQTAAIHSSFLAVAARQHPRFQRAGLRPGDVVPLDLLCDVPHVLFSPQGNLQGMEDAALAKLGRSRQVALTVPTFYGVARAIAQSGLIGVLPSRFATSLASRLGIACYRLPHDLPLARQFLYWHRRNTASPEHRWMREQILLTLEPLDEVKYPLSEEELRGA